LKRLVPDTVVAMAHGDTDPPELDGAFTVPPKRLPVGGDVYPTP
jgi:hypothetical protein